MIAFYAWWYPTRWLGWGRWPRYASFGRLARHMRFVDRSSRKLARQIFHCMVVHGPKLERKQAKLFRLVDVANELLAMAASISRAQAFKDKGKAEAAGAVQVTDLFCLGARRRVKQFFHDIWRNDDAAKLGVSRDVLGGKHVWL